METREANEPIFGTWETLRGSPEKNGETQETEEGTLKKMVRKEEDVYFNAFKKNKGPQF